MTAAASISIDHRLRLICVCAFVDMCAAAMVVTVLPSYLKNSVDLSASIAGVVLSVYGTVQFFASPIIGGFSDQYGHRLTLLMALLASAAGYSLLAIHSLPIVILARSIAGCFKQTQNQCRSIVCDFATEEQKIHAFGYLNSVGNFAFIFAPSLAGYISDRFGYSAVFLLTAAIFVGNAIFVYTIFLSLPIHSTSTKTATRNKERKEKVEDDERDRSSESEKLIDDNSNCDYKHSESVAEIERGFIEEIKNVNWWSQWDLMLVRLLQSLVVLLYRSNFNWLMEEKYQATTSHIGYLTSLQGLTAFVFAYFAGILINNYSVDRVRVLSHCTALMTASLAGLWLAPTLTVYVVALLCLNMSTAILRVLSLDLTVARCEPHETGLLIGIAASVTASARAVTPLVGGLLHDVNRESPVALSALGSAISHVVIVAFTYRAHKIYARSSA